MSGLWDTRSPAEQRREQSGLLRQTVLQMALGHVPFVVARLKEAGVDARTFRGLEDLGRIPPTLRGDVFDPGRNPEGARALVLHGTEEGVKRFSERAVLLRVAMARLIGGEEVQRLAVEAASRSLHVHLVPGAGGTIPVAYTRDDLNLLARAGARLARVLGLERDDRLLNLVPAGPTLDHWGIFYMAHGMGMSALHARPRAGDLGAALGAAFEGGRPTALAVPAEEVLHVASAAAEAGMDLSELRLLVAVGRSLSAEERAGAARELAAAGAPEARVGAAYGVAEGRVLWGECVVPPGHAESYGFHTYPDLDLVEVLSPESGAPVPAETPGEIAVTPLGFRGGGAPRWRSGDLALGGITARVCPNCGRTVPRVGPSVRRSAWLRPVVLNGAETSLDLREAGAAVARHAEGWQLEIVRRGAANELFVYLVTRSEDPDRVIDLFEELERMEAAPTQIVLSTPEQLAARHRLAGGAWPRFWERTG
ncbi:MAG: hypothetical protein HY775_09870 [Acidobacteria bacterium]|nr:hypothetical protein [Acidobacteriota bacterium]